MGTAAVRLVDMQVPVAIAKSRQVNGYHQVTGPDQCINIVAPAKCRSAEAMNQQYFAFSVFDLFFKDPIMKCCRIDFLKIAVLIWLSGTERQLNLAMGLVTRLNDSQYEKHNNV